jgi:hypothetical protein
MAVFRLRKTTSAMRRADDAEEEVQEAHEE